MTNWTDRSLFVGPARAPGGPTHVANELGRRDGPTKRLGSQFAARSP